VVSPTATAQELTLVIIRRMCPSVRMGQDHLHPLRQLQRQGQPKERPPRAHIQRQPPGKQPTLPMKLQLRSQLTPQQRKNRLLTSTKTNSTTPTNVTPPPGDISCPEEQKIFMLYREDCTRYYICLEGIFSGIRSCAQGLWFSWDLQACLSQWADTCPNFH
jgi:hypothetical protein